jgi:DnaJ-domain-containing protein 1
MHVSANASALARTLLALARARATGALKINGEDRAALRCCELSVVDGEVRAAAFLGEPQSACDALSALTRVLDWTRVRTQLVVQQAEVDATLAPFSMGELLLMAAERALAEELPADSADGPVYVERSAFGCALERLGTQLVPASLTDRLASGELYLNPQVIAELTASEHARIRAALWIGALAPRQAGSRAYTLLLRKHRQVRTRADPHALLELAPNARAADARRALRRLASRLHPDALGPAAPPALRALSSELMCALVQAERDVSREARP